MTLPGRNRNPGSAVVATTDQDATAGRFDSSVALRPANVTTTYKRVLTQPCPACNREAWQPMCDLCADMEQAEETASERRDDEQERD